MTLTLDDVRNMKFRIARRSGYEVLDVDQFVDRVEEAFAQLTEENQQLKRQVADLTEAAETAMAESENTVIREEPASWSPPAAAPTTAPPAASEPVAAAAKPAVAQGGASRASDAERIVVSSSEDASPAVVRLVQLATEQAERLVEEADEESGQIVAKAEQEASTITSKARSQAERLESEARLAADRLRNDAQGRAKAFDEELVVRRRDTFAAMETERDQLRDSVSKLRGFEQSYRTNLTDHLKAQIRGLDSGVFEPAEAPALLAKANDEDRRGSRRGESGGGSTQGRPSQGGSAQSRPSQGDSETPRLDALLGGDH